MLIMDFETRSRCNLLTDGAYKYAGDSSTDIICAAFINEAGRKWLWFPGALLPLDLMEEIIAADFIGAHNAEFDRLIWEFIAVNEYGFPTIPPEKWYCTSAQCRVNGLPAKLSHAGWALGLKQQKYDSGAALIKKLSIPQADGSFNFDPALVLEMGSYCVQDCIATKAIVDATRSMTASEHRDWLNNFDVNDRGIRVDLPLARAAMQYATAEQTEIGKQLAELTGGFITKHTQSARTRDFIRNRVADSSPIFEMMVAYKKGVRKFSLDKSVRQNILATRENGSELMTDAMYEVVALMDSGNKSSVSKFKRMGDMADPDDSRVRGAFLFAGAASTLRYTSRGVQVHNMRRDCWGVEDTETLRAQMQLGNYLRLNNEPVKVMEGLSKLLRPTLIPAPGKTFVVGDWSAIEGRVLPWLSNSKGGDKVLDIFRAGEDIYEATATAIGIESRQIGKVATLALGYQGSVGAFQSMAKNYGLVLADSEVSRIVAAWRLANPWCVRLWAGLDNASKSAMGKPGHWFKYGRVEYIFLPDFIGGTLICKLPGEHMLQYPQARMEEVETPWGGTAVSITALKASFKPKADASEWPRGTLYGGLLAENVSQSFAGCLLRDLINKLDAVVLHCHDEVVQEVDVRLAAVRAEQLKTIMEIAPDWAAGLPLKAEPKIMSRYGK